MESNLPPIRLEPISIVVIATSAASIESVVARWLRFVEQAPAGSQLLVLADRAVDSLASHARMRIVHHARPLGLGASLQTSLWSVETPLVLFVQADGSFAPEQAEAFLVAIDRADAVVGCRRSDKISPLVPLWDFVRGIASRIFLGNAPEPRIAWPGWRGWRRRFVARRLFGVPLVDPESGVVLARRAIFDRIPIQSSGTFAWVELLAKANHLGCLLDEAAIDGPGRPGENFARDAWRVFRHPDFGRAHPGSK